MEGVIGEIRGFGGNFAPRAWAFCNGQLLSINSNQALFSILGTTYGGDGRTTFGLPDLRGRGPISAGTGPGLSTHKLGARSGTETVTLTQNQMPSHMHSAGFTETGGVIYPNASTNIATSEEPGTNKYLAVPDAGGNGFIYNTDTPDTTMGPSEVTITGNVTVFNTGGSQYHNNMQPYLVINWIVCLQGVFPSRS
jgi:microcystin-dependent protein